MSLWHTLRIPLWSELGAPLEHATLMRDPVIRGEGVARGRGEPVLLIPGFLAGDLSLGLMARWLARIGYRPARARIRANIDCTERSLGRLRGELEAAVARHGGKASIVGHSRGGTMARILAVRHPELVRSIVCLGSPMRDQFSVQPLVGAQVRAVATLGSLGLRGFFSHGCASSCCAEAMAEVHARFPADVGFTSIYSRRDGIVSWRACLDPAAERVEVRASHVGMAVSALVYSAVAEALAASPPGEAGSPSRAREGQVAVA